METIAPTYYTPELEEFHIGFEYECWVDDKWYRQPLDENDLIDFRDFNRKLKGLPSEIRVKYLDKEDIESLGFKEGIFEKWGEISAAPFMSDGDEIKEKQLFIKQEGKHKYEICAWLTPEMPTISIYWNNSQVYSGECKNKSKLKSILKDVGII